jgi:predicted metal-dependent peptidase
MQRPWPIGFWWCIAISQEGWEDAMDYLKANNGRDVPTAPASVTIFEKGSSQTVVVYFNPSHIKNCDPVEMVGLIAHEATHVMQYVQKYMSENNPGWEWQAYTMQYLVQEMVRVLRLHNGRLEFNAKESNRVQ